MIKTKQTYISVCLLAILLACLCLPVGRAYAAGEIAIFVDNVPAFSEVSPYESHGALLVPVRLISEELGASVQWSEAEQQVLITGDEVEIVLRIGQAAAVVNGKSQALAAAPQIKRGTVFVPLRFIAEALSSDVLYRDQKIFLYTPQYEDTRAISNIFEHGKSLYFYQDGKIYYQTSAADKMPDVARAQIIIEKPYSYGLAAVSNSGILFSSSDGGKYYSLKDGEISDYPLTWTDSNWGTPLTSIGKYFHKDLAESKKSDEYVAINGVKIPVEQRQRYWAIFSEDIDGTNKKEIFVEENQYGIGKMAYYDGWIYYQRMVPVARDWGYDTYSGSINRIPADGGERQQLTTEGDGAERIGAWSIQKDGLHYEQYGEEKILPFAEMKNIK